MTTENEFMDERDRAVEISVQMDKRVALLSMAAYWPHRMTRSDDAEAKKAADENRQDAATLERFVGWGLDHHAGAMCAWAESAAALACSPDYTRGWEEAGQLWRLGQRESDQITPVYLAWLIAMWHRAQTTPCTSPKTSAEQ